MNPRDTLTTSPRRPTCSTSVRRITSISSGSGGRLTGDVGKERHLARPLHGGGDLLLMPAARACDPARADLSLLRDVPAELAVVLVVDLLDLLLAEVTALPPGRSGRGRSASSLLRLGRHRLEGNVVVGARGPEVGLVGRHAPGGHVLGLPL